MIIPFYTVLMKNSDYYNETVKGILNFKNDDCNIWSTADVLKCLSKSFLIFTYS